MKRAAIVIALCACSKHDTSGDQSAIVKPQVFADISMSVPDGWTSSYDKDTDAWHVVSVDARTTVQLERADERFVASPDAYMHHLEPRWPGKLVTIEQREHVAGGFVITLGVFAGANDPHAQHATYVVRKLGKVWYRCFADGTEDEPLRNQVIALCRSVRDR